MLDMKAVQLLSQTATYFERKHGQFVWSYTNRGPVLDGLADVVYIDPIL